MKFLESNFLITELVCVLLLLLGLIMRANETANSGIVILISCGGLGILYFLTAFIPTGENESSLLIIIGYKVLHISWAVATVGLLFLIQNYPGAMNQASIGAITMIGALVLIILSSLKSWDARVTQSIIRSLIILLLLYVFVYLK